MSYEKIGFMSGQTLKAEHMNYIKQGIANVDKSLSTIIPLHPVVKSFDDDNDIATIVDCAKKLKSFIYAQEEQGGHFRYCKIETVTVTSCDYYRADGCSTVHQYTISLKGNAHENSHYIIYIDEVVYNEIMAVWEELGITVR